MKRRAGVATAVLLSLALANGALGVPPGDDFGAGITLSEPADFGDVVADPAKYAGEVLLLHGRISDVCQMKGCWLMLSEGEHAVRIHFADYAFFVPKDCSGKLAYVEGSVKQETLSERDAKHYARESQDDDSPEIRGPQDVVSFTASGVRILAESEPE
jgi:hypothetical protein